MQFGMPTLLSNPTLADAAALCRALGLSFVEINMNLPMYQGDRLREEVRKARGATFTLHLDEALNPFDFNPRVAEAYRVTALDTIRFARAEGIPIVNMHFPMGVFFRLPDRKVYLFDVYRGEVRGKIERFRDEVDKAANGAVSVCIENTTFGGFAHLTEALDLLLSSPAFALTYDCGHDHTDGGRAKAFYTAHADRVKHIHLHDAAGANCHLPLGTGEIDAPSVMRMGECARIVLETKDEPGLRASVNWLSERNLIV